MVSPQNESSTAPPGQTGQPCNRQKIHSVDTRMTAPRVRNVACRERQRNANSVFPQYAVVMLSPPPHFTAWSEGYRLNPVCEVLTPLSIRHARMKVREFFPAVRAPASKDTEPAVNAIEAWPSELLYWLQTQ
jgi:hypothetical protein